MFVQEDLVSHSVCTHRNPFFRTAQTKGIVSSWWTDGEKCDVGIM